MLASPAVGEGAAGQKQFSQLTLDRSSVISYNLAVRWLATFLTSYHKGNSMTTATTSETIVNTVKSAFDFTVDKFPLNGPDGLQTPLYGLFRSDNNTFVGKPCPKRYVAHQTDDVLALVESAPEAFDGIGSVQCHFGDGHHVVIAPDDSERRSIYGTKDNIFPRVMINAGYDGRSFKAVMGFYRDACSNLAMLHTVNQTAVSIRHSSGLRQKMDDLINTFSVLRESWGTLADVIQELQKKEVRMVDFLNSVYGEPDETNANKLTRHKNRTEAIFRRLADERFRTQRPNFDDEFTVSAWEAYNVVQGYVQHEATRKQNPSDLARIIAASKDTYVKKAETLAMATLTA